MSEHKKEYKIDGRQSTIFRVKKSAENPYVMIDRRPIDNPKLSFKAKGILTYLMSRPDGWEVNVTDLMNHSDDGAASIRTGLRELRDAHHVMYNTEREGGHIKRWVIEVYEIPYCDPLTKDEIESLPDDLLCDFQQVENLQVEYRGQVLSTLSNKQLNHSSSSTPTTAEIFTFYANNIELLTEFNSQVVGDLIDTYSAHWVMEALKETAAQGKHSVSYATGILKRWKADGFKVDTRQKGTQGYAKHNSASQPKPTPQQPAYTADEIAAIKAHREQYASM